VVEKLKKSTLENSLGVVCLEKYNLKLHLEGAFLQMQAYVLHLHMRGRLSTWYVSYGIMYNVRLKSVMKSCTLLD
jgi:hypothetical protein